MRDTALVVAVSKAFFPKDCIPSLKTFSLYKYNGERFGPSNTTSLMELEPISIIPILFKIFKMIFFFFMVFNKLGGAFSAALPLPDKEGFSIKYS